MPRKKGSKNKPKEESVKFTEKIDVMPAVPVNKKPWTPAPDMGSIKAPADAEKVCSGCSHKKGLHYGGKADWCNSNGCNCQAFA